MSAPLRVAVVDDEAVAQRRMVRLLGAVAGIELAFVCGSADELLARLEDEEIDVVLLDVQMPGLTGIEAKKRLPDDGPYVIFATAHPEHAVSAFDVGGGDYLLKPIDEARLARALERARRYLERPRPAASAPLSRIAIVTQSGIVLAQPSEISHAVWDGALVSIHAAGRVLLSDGSLQDLEAKLPPDVFERVHRRAILNLEHVDLLEPTRAGGYVARTRSGDQVEVSRQAARRLRRRLGLV